ncbi:hypothetical protein [Rhodopirellula sp. P2]|uniref:hypothetical protein n=1 Tax=Rhodopirellula sp. P2 TaxID=2127060 RepID=UPI0023681709|nr:hypothetical protein [Rhodopirellula sp. P2]WDQ14564.1 hypothetical protein PSR62_13005 [Rhodopirellula sp. P2]
MSQLLTMVPSDWDWTLDSIANTQRLSLEITADRLHWIADQFGVRRNWITGLDNQIYDLVWGYKQLDRLAHSLAERKTLGPSMRMTAFVDERNHMDSEVSHRKPVALVASTPMQVTDDHSETVLRHVVCGDDFAWSNWATRRDLEAFTRWCFQEFTTFTRIVPVTSKVVGEIRSGDRFPGPYIPTAQTSDWQLEDYTLTIDESVCAKETHEVDQVTCRMEQALCGFALPVNRNPCSIIGRRSISAARL